MRYHALLALVCGLAAASPAQARLFWQTYGATVAAPGGEGCVWNTNQDYFVPRYCDTGRYGLFSACKESHTTSAACRNLHPIYQGYCSPYGACHYCWRDHVYKCHCGCTPHRCYHGPWRVERCPHCCVLRCHGGCHRGCGSACHGGCGLDGGHFCGSGRGYPYGDFPTAGGQTASYAAGVECLGVQDADGLALEDGAWPLPHVEPFGGEILGSIPAITGGPGGAAIAGGAPDRVGTGVVSVPMGSAPRAIAPASSGPPPIPGIPSPAAGVSAGPLLPGF